MGFETLEFSRLVSVVFIGQIAKAQVRPGQSGMLLLLTSCSYPSRSSNTVRKRGALSSSLSHIGLLACFSVSRPPLTGMHSRPICSENYLSRLDIIKQYCNNSLQQSPSCLPRPHPVPCPQNRLALFPAPQHHPDPHPSLSADPSSPGRSQRG